MNRLGAFLLLPLYTRYLSTAQYGTLEVFYAISTVVSGILSVGIAHATLRFYFEYSDDADRQTLVSTNLIASALITLVGVAVVWAFGDPLLNWILGQTAPTWALPVVLATLVLELSSQVALAFLRAREMSVFFICLSFGKLIVQCTTNALLLSQWDAGIVGVLSGNLLAVALGWLVLTGYTLRHCGIRFQMSKLMPVLRYSLPFLYITIISAVSSNLDRFGISKLASMEALGIYALALKFSKLVSDLIGEPFNRAYGAFRFTIMKRPDAAVTQARILRYVAITVSWIGLGIAYFTSDALRLMAAPQYWDAAKLMPLLTVAAGLQVLNYIVQTGILYNKSTHQLVHITVMRLVVGLVIGLPLIWWLGATGACLLAFIDSVLSIYLTHRISQRYFPVQYEHGRLLALSGLLVLFYLVSLVLPGAPLWAELGAKCALWALFLVVVLLSMVVDTEERSWLHGRWTRLKQARSAQ